MSRTEHFTTGASEHHQMPVAQAREYTDPVFHPWSKFHSQEAGYISNLASDIKQHGIKEPLTVRAGMLFDGHHRLAAAEHLGMTHVPVRFETGSRNRALGIQGKTTDPHPPWRDRLKT